MSEQNSCLAKYLSTLAKMSSPFLVASKFEENKRSFTSPLWTNQTYTRSKASSAIVVDSSNWMANFDTQSIFINWSVQTLAIESILCLMVSLDIGTVLTFSAALFPHSATMSSSTGFINVSPMLCGFFCLAIARLATNKASVLLSSCLSTFRKDSSITS